MGKIAFVFPGQGTQKVGMGKDFYETFPIVKKVFDRAGSVTGVDVAKLCFEENEQLDQTEYTQLALLTVEVAILRVVESLGITADYSAGLSLGEYGALAACNCMEEEDLFRLIRARGLLMQEAYPVGGAMCAVLGLDAGTIASICEKTEGIVSIANDNCPGQIVITGQQDAVEKAAAACKEAGAKRCLPLKVSGPFHSKLLTEAGEKLAWMLETIPVRELQIPYVCNLEARIVEDKNAVKSLLKGQISGPVRFRESILALAGQGVDTFVEIGPGKTLNGFIRKTCPEAVVYNVEKVEDLEGLKAALCTGKEQV